MSSVVQNTMSFTDDVSLVDSRINSHMCQNMVEGRLSLTSWVIDLETNALRWPNAGHKSPLIRKRMERSRNSTKARLELPVESWYGYPERSRGTRIGPDEMFVLITDGVDEAMDPDNNLYTKERVREIVRTGSQDPEELGRALLADVRRHANGRAQNDDITIMTFGRFGDLRSSLESDRLETLGEDLVADASCQSG